MAHKQNHAQIASTPVQGPLDVDDFNNVLTTMLGVCTLLEDKASKDPEIVKYVSLLRASVERANSLAGRIGHR